MKRFPIFILLVLVLAFAVSPAFALQGDPPPVFDWSAISQALQNLALLVIPALGAYVAHWLKAKANVEKEKLSAWQLQAFDIFLHTMVYAAEQMKIAGYINDKLVYVTVLAEMWLFARGITMDLDELRARIESAVKQELNNDPDPVQAG